MLAHPPNFTLLHGVRYTSLTMIFHIWDIDLFVNPFVMIPFLLMCGYMLYLRVISRLQSLPGPTRWLVLGNIPDLAFTDRIYDRLLRFRDDYGDIVQLRLGPNVTLVVVYGHRNLHKLLVENCDKTKYRPNWLHLAEKMFDRTGVIWSNGDHWFHMKRFTLTALKDFGIGQHSLEERVVSEARTLVRVLRHQKGCPIDLDNIIPKAVSNIISGLVFGSRFHYDDEDFLMLLGILDFLFKHAGYNRPENLFPFLENMPFSKIGKIMENQKKMEDYIKIQIQKHKETYDPCNIRDFIDLYIQREYDDTEDDITEKSMLVLIFDLYAAGTETSSTTLLWIVLYLIRYPRVQTKCRAEIRRVIGSTRDASMQDKENMPYVTATINEIQRMASIGPLGLPHACLEDIDMGGKVIPKNSLIIPHIMSAHYDQNFWSSPSEFKPERFISKDRRIIKHQAFYPFSMGPRACLGKNLAEMELFIITVTLLQNFTFTSVVSPENLSLQGRQTGITLMPPSYQVKAVQRRMSRVINDSENNLSD